jgi:hypothetical protein
MAGRGDVKERGGECAHVMPGTANPCAVIIILAGQHNPVAPFNIGHGAHQRGKCLLVQSLSAGMAAKRVAKMDCRIRCKTRGKRPAKRGPVAIAQGLHKGGDQGLVAGGIAHSAASP